MENQSGPIVKTPTEARAGRLGRPVLWVLVISCLLAAGVLLGMTMGYFV